MLTASHPSSHQNLGRKSGASSPAPRQAIFSPDSTRRLVVGYVSFDSRLVVGWWSVTCRLVVDWWSVCGRFLKTPFTLNPCQHSPPSQNPLRNSITTLKNAPKPTPIPRPISPIQTSSFILLTSLSSVSSVAKTKHAPDPSPIQTSSFTLHPSPSSATIPPPFAPVTNPMLAKVHSFVLIGIDPLLCEVEVDVSQRGLVPPHRRPRPDRRQRIHRARPPRHDQLRLPLPQHALLINLAPADVKKEGPASISPSPSACSAAPTPSPPTATKTSSSPANSPSTAAPQDQRRSLHGAARQTEKLQRRHPPRGQRPRSRRRRRHRSLSRRHPRPSRRLPQRATPPRALRARRPALPAIPALAELQDFADVRGQEAVKRAITIAAAGSHNLLMVGPPGTGKTMLAQRIPGILPPLTRSESLETTRIYSAMRPPPRRRRPHGPAPRPHAAPLRHRPGPHRRRHHPPPRRSLPRPPRHPLPRRAPRVLPLRPGNAPPAARRRRSHRRPRPRLHQIPRPLHARRRHEPHRQRLRLRQSQAPRQIPRQALRPAARPHRHPRRSPRRHLPRTHRQTPPAPPAAPCASRSQAPAHIQQPTLRRHKSPTPPWTAASSRNTATSPTPASCS